MWLSGSLSSHIGMVSRRFEKVPRATFSILGFLQVALAATCGALHGLPAFSGCLEPLLFVACRVGPQQIPGDH